MSHYDDSFIIAYHLRRNNAAHAVLTVQCSIILFWASYHLNIDDRQHHSAMAVKKLRNWDCSNEPMYFWTDIGRGCGCGIRFDLLFSLFFWIIILIFFSFFNLLNSSMKKNTIRSHQHRLICGQKWAKKKLSAHSFCHLPSVWWV